VTLDTTIVGKSESAVPPARRHSTVAAVCVGLVVGMGALSYAAVPLYRMFCQATGFGGATNVAIKPSDVTLDRTIVVRFDANVSPGLGWTFAPVQPTMTVKLGENALAFYTATNTTDKVIKGTAAFNVAPELAGRHFSKIACFCFTEQTLKPGETVEMPVSFFIDPKLASDRDASWINEITLSYTFYASSGSGQGS
jgi:cytochrome c oxidase assembly protein subunit 11